MAFIFVASSVPGSQLPAAMWDKLAHLLVYAALGVFFLIPLARGRLSGVTVSAAGLAVVLSFLYGLSDEFHQMFTPGRSPDILDVAADTIGAASGVVSVLLLAALVRAFGFGAPQNLRNPRGTR
jgi:VanZ family protein